MSFSDADDAELVRAKEACQAMVAALDGAGIAPETIILVIAMLSLYVADRVPGYNHDLDVARAVAKEVYWFRRGPI